MISLSDEIWIDFAKALGIENLRNVVRCEVVLERGHPVRVFITTLVTSAQTKEFNTYLQSQEFVLSDSES